MRRITRLQSAMEYLMTYGWAILIIAIVLAALFSLGVFGSGNLGAKAPPGSCQVFRPQGPGTTTNLNLQGVCAGLLPKYVVRNTGSSTVEGAHISGLGLSYTVSLWFNTPTASGLNCCSNPVFDIYNITYNNGVGAQGGGGEEDFGAGFVTGQGFSWGEYWPWSWQFTDTGAVSTGVWHNAVVSVTNYGSVVIYIDGVQKAAGTVTYNAGTLTGNFMRPAIAIGSNPPGSDEYAASGSMISNVQLYNAAFSAADAQAQYQEGLGGAPTQITALVGWWPLNGDANDYSGNGSNGVPVNIVYTTSWASGYPGA